MKKVLSLLLTAAMLISCAACSAVLPEETAARTAETEETAVSTGAGLHDATGFSVGFSRKVITPKFSVPLAGYGRTSQRYHKKVLDDITLSAIAVSDGENTAFLITQDIVRCNPQLTMQARKNISKKTGVPVENILIAGTHTHSSIDPDNLDDAVSLWKTIYYRQILAACEEALADLDSAGIQIGSVQTENMTFTRRYFLKDGTFIGDNSGTTATDDNPVVRSEAKADEELQIIRFVRKNQKDVVIANFQGHPTKTGGSTKYDMSADYVYPFRREVEKEADVHCAFFLGSSGNQNTTSRLLKDVNISDYVTYGKKLADYALGVMEDLVPVESGKVLSENRTYTAVANKVYDEELLDAAGRIRDLWNDMKTSEAKALCQQYGISSPYAAGTLLSRQKYDDTYPMECCAVSFGDVAFVTAGFEMFSTTQLAIKAGSPFKMTFILTCSQEKHGYMPTADVFPNGGYEVDTCRYVAGTAEEIQAVDLEMLEALYAAR